MKNLFLITAAMLIGMSASPALADDMGVDTDSMVNETAIIQYDSVDLPVIDFDLAQNRNTADFMAIMADKNIPGYRLKSFDDKRVLVPVNSGLVELFVPQEYALQSRKQDSGVDAVTPGRFLSHSVRPDFLSDNGPAAFDKSTVGVRFGF